MVHEKEIISNQEYEDVLYNHNSIYRIFNSTITMRFKQN